MSFEASGQRFAYMVPSAAVFAFDDCSSAVIDRLRERPRAPAELLAVLGDRFSPAELRDTLTELHRVRAIEDQTVGRGAEDHPAGADANQTLVVNVTNQCNLSCEYCYQYGEDKIVDTENGSQPKFMSEETAQAAVDLALKEAGVGKTAHITFFGGETLMNFKVLKPTVGYADAPPAAQGKLVDFSLTTNATLLQPDVIDFLADERIGVTISIDGPQEIQDKFRVFSNGQGSYDIAAPKDQGAAGPAHHPADRRPGDADQADARRPAHLQPPVPRHGLLGSRLRPGDHRAAARPRHRRHRPRPAGAVPGPAQDFLQASLQNKHHGFSNVRARRCRRSITGTPRPIRAGPASDCSASPPTARCRCATASPGRTRIGSDR